MWQKYLISLAFEYFVILRVVEAWYARYLADPQAVSDLAERKKRRSEALKVQRRIAALKDGRLDQAARIAFQDGLRDLTCLIRQGGREGLAGVAQASDLN